MDAQKIVVTVPHARCPEWDLSMRVCDIAAEKFARMLQERLQLMLRELRDPRRLVVLLGEVSRKRCDLNRIQCRGEPFREAVRAELRAGDVILLDVHSFPRGEFPGTHVVFLDVERSVLRRPSPFVRELHVEMATMASLSGARIRTEVIAGTQVNDILLEAIQMGNRRNALVEIDESLSVPQMHMLAEWMAQAVAMAWFRRKEKKVR